MEMLQLYVVYDEYLKPVDSNIGSFNRYNHKIDRINIEINEALPEHTFYLNVKRPDGTVNLLGYEVVQVDGTNYYFDVPAWVTEKDGLVEFSLVASTLSQVISFGKFYVDCIDTLQATAQATPDDPTFLSKVDKDLSTYEEVTLTDDTLARVYVDDDGEPSQMTIGALVDKAQQEIPFLSFENPTTHTPLLEGEIAWNETQGTLDIGMKGGNVTQQIGMELYIRCRNDDSVTITDGMVVYSVGTVGASGVIRIMRASASDDEVSGRVIGVATESIAPNGVGYVTVLGEINGINTALMTPEATLYLGENGAFTEVVPTAPTKKIVIGRVMRVAVNGSIYVRLQKGVSLKELDDVVQNGTATGGILVYDSVAGTWGTGDVTFTEADNDLYINTDLDKIVLNKATEVNGNLNVKGILTQDGSAYETHLEQLYTEKDHIILRDGAVSGLGVGSYAGLFAKLADGTNNSGLVFDGDGMARVGDIGTNLASPDFSQTQALATRQDSPVSNAVAYWNDTLKRFDTSSKFTFNGSVGSINELTVTNDAIGDVPLIVNAMVGTTAHLQDWKLDGTIKAYIRYDGVLYASSNIITYGTLQNGDGSANAAITPSSTGTAISRNIADGNPALRVQNSHTVSTGNIAEFWSNVSGTTALRAKIDKGGFLYGSRFYDVTHNYTYLNMTNNGASFYRNQNDANPLLTINNQQGTGNILNLQFGGANKLEVTKDGWLFQNGVRLLHTFSHPTGSTAIPTGRNVFLGQNAGNLTMGSTAATVNDASHNVGVGYQALYSNTTGWNNTAIGRDALYSNTTGLGNTANGVFALYFNTTGSNNTANGPNAGRYFGSSTSPLTLINNSVFIGMNSRANANNDQNEIVIGYEAIGNGSNTATIGNSWLTGLYLGSATAKFYGLVDYDNTTSGLTATDQKSAIDELAGLVDGVGELLGGI